MRPPYGQATRGKVEARLRALRCKHPPGAIERARRSGLSGCGQQMQRLGRVWLAQSAGWRVHIAGVVRQWFLRIWWRFFASVQGVLRGAKPLSCFRFEGMHAKTDEPRRVFLLCGFCCLGAQARGKTRKTSNGRKAACSKSYCALRLKPIRIWIFDGIRNRLIPARDFFLEKKQKRARCSGLPSRFILCRTCRAKAACLGGVSVCIPRAAGAAYSSSTVRQIGTRLWPCACAQ